jgi:hypothetical protein
MDGVMAKMKSIRDQRVDEPKLPCRIISFSELSEEEKGNLGFDSCLRTLESHVDCGHRVNPAPSLDWLDDNPDDEPALAMLEAYNR